MRPIILTYSLIDDISADKKKENKYNDRSHLSHKLSLTALIYRVSQEECARLQEGFPYVKVYRYNPKHLYPKLNGYGDNGQRSLKL